MVLGGVAEDPRGRVERAADEQRVVVAVAGEGAWPDVDLEDHVPGAARVVGPADGLVVGEGLGGGQGGVRTHVPVGEAVAHARLVVQVGVDVALGAAVGPWPIQVLHPRGKRIFRLDNFKFCTFVKNRKCLEFVGFRIPRYFLRRFRYFPSKSVPWGQFLAKTKFS